MHTESSNVKAAAPYREVPRRAGSEGGDSAFVHLATVQRTVGKRLSALEFRNFTKHRPLSVEKCVT